MFPLPQRAVGNPDDVANSHVRQKLDDFISGKHRGLLPCRTAYLQRGDPDKWLPQLVDSDEGHQFVWIRHAAEQQTPG